MATRYWIGTSGYNYPEWRGSFYPPKFPQGEMLPFYARHFPTVEINYTFYRMPTEKLLAGWAQATPDTFRFTLKAPRRITHDSKLRGVEELTGVFCRTARALGDRLATLLFQLPPTFKKDVPILEAFLTELPDGVRAAFEFRHDSWHDEEVFAALRRRNLALCIADSERMSTPLVATAAYGYFRLRDEGYQADDIRTWAERIRVLGPEWTDAFIYFKHEEQGKGPEFARLLMDALT